MLADLASRETPDSVLPAATDAFSYLCKPASTQDEDVLAGCCSVAWFEIFSNVMITCFLHADFFSCKHSSSLSCQAASGAFLHLQEYKLKIYWLLAACMLILLITSLHA